MTSIDFAKWLAIGTGIGIEIGSQDLTVTVVRLRPSGARVLGELTIPHFREQPAADWGAAYASFLQKLGVGHLAATILLPRDEVTVRQVSLPGVIDKDLASAVRFEIDSLNPHSEEEVAYDWARIGKTTSVLIGIALRSVVERYTALFSQAGVKAACFTFSAPTIYSALRLLTDPPKDGFLALEPSEDGLELYGESATRPIFSARLDQSPERARTLAISELRLPPETQAAALRDQLPRPLAAPETYEPSRACLSYAAALSGAGLLRSLNLNLLPLEQRQSASRLRYVPTAVLSSIVLLLGVAVLAYPSYADRHYLGLVQAEIHALDPLAKKAADAQRDTLNVRNRSQTLDNFRQQTRQDLDVLNELTHVLAPPAWLSSLQLTRTSVSITGETDQAATLIKLLDSSRQFQGSSFSLPLQKSGSAELFTIRSSRKGVPQ
ncbi:MAG TPA: PilN domain-containing protein [Bryobacteraceae bacterium]|nr:PilN domain-containing protein [Bryobacteraceae bacterium]